MNNNLLNVLTHLHDKIEKLKNKVKELENRGEVEGPKKKV